MSETTDPPTAEAVERVKEAHSDLLGLAAAAADGDADSVHNHSDNLRDAIGDVEDLIDEVGER